MSLDNITDIFDFDDFDYFYHETSVDCAKSIMENGLLVEGTNIIGADNLLFTTTCSINEEIASSSEAFRDYIESEFSPSDFRDVSAMVILGAGKEENKQIVERFESTIDGKYYEGIIRPKYVVGYVDMEELEFYPNDNYEYIDEVETNITHGRR